MNQANDCLVGFSYCTARIRSSMAMGSSHNLAGSNPLGPHSAHVANRVNSREVGFSENGFFEIGFARPVADYAGSYLKWRLA